MHDFIFISISSCIVLYFIKIFVGLIVMFDYKNFLGYLSRMNREEEKRSNKSYWKLRRKDGKRKLQKKKDCSNNMNLGEQ